MSITQQIIFGLLGYMGIGLFVSLFFLHKSEREIDPDMDRVRAANVIRHMLFFWPIHIYVYVGLRIYGNIK